MSITTSTRRYTPKEQMILDAGIAMGREEERDRITKLVYEGLHETKNGDYDKSILDSFLSAIDEGPEGPQF